jgi:hypothetical protein
MVLAVHFTSKKQWGLAGFLFALSLQVKLFSILIAPWCFAEVVRDSATFKDGAVKLGKALSGIGIGFLLFLPFHISAPSMFLFPREHLPSDHTSFYWNMFNEKVRDDFLVPWMFYANNIFSYLMVAIGLALIIWAIRKFDRLSIDLLPFVSFWIAVKSVSFVQIWYTTIAPGLLITVSHERRWIVHAMLILNIIFSVQSSYHMFGGFSAFKEHSIWVNHMRNCLWTCEF